MSLNGIAVCSRSFSRNLELRSILNSKFSNVKYNLDGVTLKSGSLIKFLKYHEAAIIGLEVIDDSVLSEVPHLKVIGKYGVGLDNIDLDACERHGVRIGWKPGVNARAVAELALNMALTIVRNTSISYQHARNGDWKQVVGRELSSLTIGILGCGHVGQELLKLLYGFGSNVIVFDKLDKTETCALYNARQVDFDVFLEESDLISIHLPKTPETVEMLSTPRLRQLKPGSYIVNTARGGLVSEEYLINALNSNALAGVALDVLEGEPVVNDQLISNPRCYITTHIGGSSIEAILAMGRAAIEGLENNLLAADLLDHG